MGDNLVAIGAIDQAVLDEFIHRIPNEPKDIAATGVDETELLALLMKLIYTCRLRRSGSTRMPSSCRSPIVIDLVNMAIERQLLYTLGSHSSDSLLDMRYALTDEGRRWTHGRDAALGIRRARSRVLWRILSSG